MTPCFEPVAGTHLFYVDGAGVLFSESTQELHLLNTTATAIWSLLEEGHDAVSASAALREMYGMDTDCSSQFVVAALAEWRGKGLMAGSSRALPEQLPTVQPITTPKSGPAWKQMEVVEQRNYRILGTRFRVSYSSFAQVQMVHPILEHLEVPESSDKTTAVDILEAPDRLIVYRDREVFAFCARITELAPIVKTLVWMTTVNGHHYFLDIHAGVISDGSRCIVLPAPAGSGKSTLTAALVKAGYQYFSDEVALLEEGSFRVFPLPLAIGVKSSGINALTDHFPNLRGLTVHERGDGKRVVYLSPPPESLPEIDAPLPVAALVFPKYSPDSKLWLAGLSKGDALKRLMDECVAVPSRLDFEKVEGLVQWVSRTPCLSLAYGSTVEAVAAIQSLFQNTHGESRPVVQKT